MTSNPRPWWLSACAWMLAAALILVTLYGSYWVVKTVSYKLFYEDMVRTTVREMVAEEALKR